MQTYFYQLADFLTSKLAPGEVHLASLSAEDSTFIRFNQCRVRQATQVRQLSFSLSLIANQRRADASLTLSGERADDEASLSAALLRLRQDLPGLAADPYLLYATEVCSTEHLATARLPDAGDVIDAVLTDAAGTDLVGLYAGGSLYRGFANSLGQRNWHQADNFNFEWCLYATGAASRPELRDKAVKSSYAGSVWAPDQWQARLGFAKEQVARLSDAPRLLQPGRYRTYLSPAAMGEVAEMLSWGGFGLKSQRTKQSCLMRMVDEGARLNAMVSIRENTREGIACGFQGDGFLKAPSVDLIRGGQLADALVSPRSAREFGVATNGANLAESPESLDLAGGGLARADILATLDTGLYIGNLWYLNFSDRTACRLTGMTRFACFWVENGSIRAPLNVMRFDDTIYRMLGDNLAALTEEPELLPSASSYGERSTLSMRLPGAIIDDLALTL